MNAPPVVGDRRCVLFPAGAKALRQRDEQTTPTIVIGLCGSAFSARAAAQFRTMGWNVVLCGTPGDARLHAVRTRAHALVVGVDEDGLLDVAKMIQAMPRKTKIVFVAPDYDESLDRASAFLGAGFVTETEGVSSLARAVLGMAPVCCN